MSLKAGIYVHVPFCVSKCRYCSFNSVPFDKDAASAYLDALIQEIRTCPHEAEPVSLYIGGGTPTTLPGEAIVSIIAEVKKRFRLPAGAEVTVEANPGTLGGLDLRALRDAGVSRVSLGVQSFDPGELLMLGRIHGAEEVDDAVVKLKESGFDNINMDLIYSLPGQDAGKWAESLKKAVSLNVQHISLYDLSLEEGTPLYAEAKAGRLTLPPEPEQVDMYLYAIKYLEENDFKRYEVSNFAVPGRECVHNLNYWSGGDFIGFGAGAWTTAGYTRRENVRRVSEYIGRVNRREDPSAFVETLSRADKEREYIMLGLRRSEGISMGDFRARFGHGLEERSAAIERLAGSGYLERDGEMLRLSLKGVLASNMVVPELF